MERSKELQKKENEFSKRFFYSILGVLFLNMLLSVWSNYVGYTLYVVPTYLFVILCILAIYTGLLLYKVKYNFRAVFIIVLCVFFILFTYLSLILSNISEVIFLYYFPVVALFLMLTDFKKTLLFTLAIMVLCYVLPKISLSLGISLDKSVFEGNHQALKFKEYEVVTISTFYTFFILYYMVKFIEIKNKTSTEGETDPSVEIPAFSLNVADASPLREEDSRVERLQHLYNRIIILFEEEKPFQYPEFNIRTLADKVNSNTSYVSAALNKMGNKKFNQLVNEYRIEQVKILMKENVHYKFTLEHIYTNAGFSSQSTFNRIFKEHTGLTPTEYIERL